MDHSNNTSYEYFYQNTPNDPYLNMAIDECLLNQSNFKNLPILNFYFWNKHGFTCGFSQAENLIKEHETKNKLPFLTRRITGGGIVHHGIANSKSTIKNVNLDLTLSCIIPRNHHLSKVKPRELYKMIHLIILNSINDINSKKSEIILNKPDTKKREIIPKECFASPVEHDVLIKDINDNKFKKVVGSSQKRSKYGVLSQTSIQNIGSYINFKDLANLISENFVKKLFSKSKPKKPTTPPDTLINDAKKLANRKYSKDDWKFQKKY